MFFTAITFFSYNTLNVNSLECVSMNNHKCKEGSETINVDTVKKDQKQSMLTLMSPCFIPVVLQ